MDIQIEIEQLKLQKNQLVKQELQRDNFGNANRNQQAGQYGNANRSQQRGNFNGAERQENMNESTTQTPPTSSGVGFLALLF